MNAGWIGGIVGVAGGIFGTYCSIRNTNGPRERAFMIRAAAICWVGILIFVVLVFVLPHPYRLLMWIPYGILLPLGIVTGNRMQQRIRQEEAAERRTHSETP